MNKLLEPLHHLNTSLKRTTHIYMVLVATLIGLLGGLGAVGFRFLIQEFQRLFWSGGAYTLDFIASLPTSHLLLAPTIGGILVGSIVRFFAREAKGHGVPEVMEAVALRSGHIRPRVVVAKSLASSLCIASGGSVGREGPIVQIGSAIGSSLGQLLTVNPRRLRTLVGCGAAAGIAATFNAPVAGALFAVEVILGDFAVPQFSPIVISSVVATVISRHYLGDFPAFEIPHYSMVHPIELAAYVVLGMLAGLVALSFTLLLSKAEDLLDKIPLPLPAIGALGGLLVGFLGRFFPGVLGVGYEAINQALVGNISGWLLLLLLLAKLLAVSLTIGSGGSGGIFAPSLFMGAMLGGGVGKLAGLLLPSVAEPGAYALVGMGAVVAGATHAPITAIVIIFELTTDYRIILPLMVSCILSTLLASRLHTESIYTEKLVKRGVRLRGGHDVNVLRKIPVEAVLNRRVPRIEPGLPLPKVVERLVQNPASCHYVVSDDGLLQGVVSLSEVRPVLPMVQELGGLVVARDVASTSWPTVNVGESLDEVIKRLDLGYRDELPVVDEGKLIGAVRMEDVLARYRNELFKHEMAATVAGTLAEEAPSIGSETVGGFEVLELDAPSIFWDKTLQELDVRKKYGANIILVRHATAAPDAEPIPPDASYLVSPGDRLVVFGARDALESLRRL